MKHNGVIPTAASCLAACVVVIAGCGGSLFAVQDGAGKNKPGIPFLPIEPVEQTTGLYEEEWAEVTLVVTYMDLKEPEAQKKADVAARAAQASGATPAAKAEAERFAQELESLIKMRTTTQRTRYMAPICARLLETYFASGETKSDAVGQVDDYFQRTTSPVLAEQASDCPSGFAKLMEPAVVGSQSITSENLRLVGVLRERLQLPASAAAYINVDKSASGKAGGTITLNTNGTLTSAQAEVEDTTFDRIMTSVDALLGQVPVKDVLVKALDLTPPAAAQANVATIAAAALRILTVKRIYAVTLRAPPGQVQAPPDGTTPLVQVVVKTIRSNETEPTPKKDEGPTIGISGSVTLPKAGGK